ncbi:MAG: ATP-grasp domain-containing protein [Planctomycetales bacterium]|nr:ATP-grasp domain-containing protein [Planctomycetales bacterium]
MHVFVYEWITGGGLVDHPGRLPESLLAEGAAMASAAAQDFLAISGCRVTRLGDPRLEPATLRGERRVEIHSEAQRRDEFAAAAAAADYTLVIAPEFDRILTKSFAAATEVGARLLGGSADLIRTASDKHRTCERLTAAGISTPAAVLIEADAERLPRDFEYPGVLKPLDGAGSQHTLLVEGPGDEPPPYPWTRRLERFCPGRPASVAAICGPGGQAILPPCWQWLSGDGRFTYRGGAIIGESGPAARATSLAERVLAALPPATGYVGIDMVLGDAPDGGDDVVIEVNPRLTTSYVGLRAAVDVNLAELMIAGFEGTPLPSVGSAAAIEFTSAGDVTNAAPG